MAASITSLLSTWVKTPTLTSLYTLLGAVFGAPLALQPGEPVAALLDTMVGWAVDDVLNPIVLPALQSAFLDYAYGPWLELRAWTDFNRPKIQQIAGTQTFVLENRGSFSGTIAAGAIRVSSTGNATPLSKGATYTNTTSGTLIAYTGTPPYPTVSLVFEADAAGSASNAQTGDFALYPTPPTKAPINIFVQQVNGPIQGADTETDPNLILRLKAVPTQLSPTPPRQAYQAVALDPAGSLTRRGITPPTTWGNGAPAITRVRVVCPGNAAITVYLASASGPAAGDSSTPDSDVYKAFLAITLVLNPFGTSTILVLAASANALSLGSITLEVDREANVTATEAAATAQAALTAYFSTLPIGGQRLIAGGQGYVFVKAVLAVLGAGLGVIDVVMTGMSNGTADYAVAAGDVVEASWTFPISVNLVSQT